MSKRTLLGALMVLVGGLSSLSLEGFILGLPLLLLGGYLLVGARLSRTVLGRAPSRV